jgi:hypothetical protein
MTRQGQLSLIASLLLTGCAQTTYWVKPDGNQALFDRMQAECHNQAFLLPRNSTNQQSAPSYRVDTISTSGSSLALSTVTPYRTPYQNMGDAFGNLAAAFDNIARTEMFVENCMVANGWSKLSDTQMSLSVAIYGKVGSAGGIYEGSATGYPDRTGTLKLKNAANNVCVGTFRYISSSYGTGIVRCDDGDTVETTFSALTNMSGYGSGTSKNGLPVRFVYGLEGELRDKYLAIP